MTYPGVLHRSPVPHESNDMQIKDILNRHWDCSVLYDLLEASALGEKGG
jgi:hypothetical protein